MTIVIFDTETERFRAGCMAPPVVCVQWLTIDGDDISAPRLINHWDVFEWARWALQQALLVGHNVFYDLAVLAAMPHGAELIPLIHRALAENRITDTEIRQKLSDIARGEYRGFFNGPVWIPRKYNLGDVSKRHAKRVGYYGLADAIADKDDPWRLYYGLLRDVPVERWHEQSFTVARLDKEGDPTGEMVMLTGDAALAYALNDPRATAAAWLGQELFYDPAWLVDQYQQCRKFWGLHLTATWGLRTSETGVRALEDWTTTKIEDLQDLLIEHRLVRPDGSKDTKAAMARMLWARPDARRTKASKKFPHGQISLDSEACEASGDHLLETYGEYAKLRKVLSFDVKNWRTGITHPIHTNFDMADTGRVTATKGVQNPRRLAGVRESVVPRGFVAY